MQNSAACHHVVRSILITIFALNWKLFRLLQLQNLVARVMSGNCLYTILYCILYPGIQFIFQPNSRSRFWLIKALKILMLIFFFYMALYDHLQKCFYNDTCKGFRGINIIHRYTVSITLQHVIEYLIIISFISFVSVYNISILRNSNCLHN